jgi:hypothetical protein
VTTITTAAALVALPHLSAVLVDKEGRACQRDTTFSPPRWWVTGTTVTLDDEDMLGFLPLTVLYRPDQPEPVKPSREGVRQAIEAAFGPTWDSAVEQGLDSAADAVLALLPGRCAPTEAEVEECLFGLYDHGASPNAKKEARTVVALFAAQPTVSEIWQAAWESCCLRSGVGRDEALSDYRSEADHG